MKDFILKLFIAIAVIILQFLENKEFGSNHLQKFMVILGVFYLYNNIKKLS